ncbi:hypothetical protein LZ198_06910 [Myxococcus sp. K15C18031901]|uniref:hypothetical protein n=1 Tax=Myxococcus dinghuensis TaxID=2906761 RepID=UPI0020A7C54A|nr:hypothetical protein [Myxococcus dinghuensis]MCP3098604.1 hypothetical protein [Myxococcus dinghuensis]
MRIQTRVWGVLALLLSTPAWASDMCPMVVFVFIPPSYLLALVAVLVGIIVRGHRAANIWLVVLLLCVVPAVGMLMLCVEGAYHGSELRHEEMILPTVIAFGVLAVAYAFSLWRLCRVQPPAPTTAGSELARTTAE